MTTETDFVAAWAEVYRKVLRYAIRLGVPRSDAEDVVSDAVLRVWERRSDVHNPAAFIIRTTRFFASHHVGATLAKYRALVVDPAQFYDLPERSTDPVALDEILAVLASLPREDRELVEGSSKYGAIAAAARVAGVSESAMRTRVCKIRDYIRLKLGLEDW